MARQFVVTKHRIPFNLASRHGKESQYLEEAFDEWHTAADGSFTRRCEALLRETVGSPQALLTTSCTHALEMCALLLNLEPGDEVIMPSFTFVSTANAFALRGAIPVFVDVRPDTMNIDEQQIAAHITERTRAIVVVHYGGVACEMDTICEIADAHGIAVIEDNAHGLFGAYKGRPLGSIGALATLSFHETKNISCGEGGALLVNDERYAARAEILRQKGTNRNAFLRGEVDKYTWVDVGSSFAISDLLAAVLFAQLEARQSIQSRRSAVWHGYQRGLAQWAESQGVDQPAVPEGCDPAWHLYHLVCPDQAFRDRVIDVLEDQGVHAVFHYVPLHTAPGARVVGSPQRALPHTESRAPRLVRLPFFNELTGEQQSDVIEIVKTVTA